MNLKSLDTNIFVYGLNKSCEEHEVASILLQEALDTPGDWIVADQVYFELYKALRNPKIFTRPLTAKEAFSKVKILRDHCGILHCCYDESAWKELSHRFHQRDFPYQRTHDAILGVTLRQAGVDIFYTRNTKDFGDYGFHAVINPIDKS